MLNQPTIDKLCAMRMRGMAEALQQQMQEPDIHQLSFEERLGLLIDRQWDWRQNRALERRLRNARLQGPACVEDIDYRTPRGLDLRYPLPGALRAAHRLQWSRDVLIAKR